PRHQYAERQRRPHRRRQDSRSGGHASRDVHYNVGRGPGSRRSLPGATEGRADGEVVAGVVWDGVGCACTPMPLAIRITSHIDPRLAALLPQHTLLALKRGESWRISDPGYHRREKWRRFCSLSPRALRALGAFTSTALPAYK